MPDRPIDRADDELRHRLIEALLDHATDYAIIATDLQGRVTLWNQGACQVLGWTEADMLGEAADRFFTPDDRAAGVPDAERRVALQHGRARDERWHQKCDGSRFWGAGELVVMRDDAGQPWGFLKIVRDRTSQRDALEAQRADAQFLRSVLTASSDCIKVLDLDARIMFINESGKRLLDITPSDALLGRRWPEIWRGSIRATAEHAVATARAGQTETFQGAADTMSGTPKWWDVRVSPMLGAAGEPEKLLVVSRDITDTIHAEQQLVRSEERLSLALNASGMIGIWDWDMPAGVIYADANAAPIYGFGAAAAAAGIPQDAFLRTIHPDDLPSLQADIDRAIDAASRSDDETGLFSREYRVLQRDGTARWVLSRGRPVRNADGCLRRFPGTVVDITDRKRSEIRRVALMELGDRLRDLDDPDEMAYAGAAAMARALDLCRAGYGVIDNARTSITIERDWSAPGVTSLAGTYRFRDYGTFIDDLRRGRIVVINDTHSDPRTADTTMAWDALEVRSLINLPLFEMGAFVALFLAQRTRPCTWLPEEIDYIRNVSDRIRVAIERWRIEQRLRDLAASLERQVAERTRERDRAWRVSRDLLGVADQAGVWRSINPAWTDILGWQPSDILGRTSEWFKHPDNAPVAFSGPASLTGTSPAASGVPQASKHHEGRYRARDGSYRWISWTVVPSEGELYCVGRDITAEKDQAAALAETEQQLRQAQKMEAVGQLTGGIAHDFNNLLAGITGSLELMQTRIGQGRTAEATRFVAAAQGAAQRAASLTHRLLAFSRRQTLDPKPTAVNKLIHGMEELIRRTVGPAIRVEVVGAAGLWTTLCDPNQLENALLNLCINARDAMPNGGRLTIETANTTLDAAAARSRDLAPGQYIALCVTDTGTGMSPEVIAHVFEPFFTTKPIGQGTGLGLSMVYGFAKQSGGQVRIHSEPEQGTTLRIFLPRHVGDTEEGDLANGAADRPARLAIDQRALVIDDEPTVLMLVCEVLHDLGYATVEASDGPTALRILQSDLRFDLMVTDVGLPGGMNGRQLADAARIARPDLKILFITGYAENAAIGNGQFGRGMEVMTKPFAVEALLAKIRAMAEEA